MAFYRCDRGLGFDISNSTGESSDVLYSKTFNNGESRKGNIETLNSFYSVWFNTINHMNDYYLSYDERGYRPSMLTKDITIPTTKDIKNYISEKVEIYGIRGCCKFVDTTTSPIKYINMPELDHIFASLLFYETAMIRYDLYSYKTHYDIRYDRISYDSSNNCYIFSVSDYNSLIHYYIYNSDGLLIKHITFPNSPLVDSNTYDAHKYINHRKTKLYDMGDYFLLFPKPYVTDFRFSYNDSPYKKYFSRIYPGYIWCKFNKNMELIDYSMNSGNKWKTYSILDVSDTYLIGYKFEIDPNDKVGMNSSTNEYQAILAKYWMYSTEVYNTSNNHSYINDDMYVYKSTYVTDYCVVVIDRNSLSEIAIFNKPFQSISGDGSFNLIYKISQDNSKLIVFFSNKIRYYDIISGELIIDKYINLYFISNNTKQTNIYFHNRYNLVPLPIGNQLYFSYDSRKTYYSAYLSTLNGCYDSDNSFSGYYLENLEAFNDINYKLPDVESGNATKKKYIFLRGYGFFECVFD